MITMIMVVITILWVLSSIAYLIAAFMKDYEVVNPAFFCALVWVILLVTTVITGMAEKQYHFYNSGVYNDFASRMA